MNLRPISEFIRTLVRPMTTLIVVIACVAFIAIKLPVPEWFQDIVKTIVLFWFIDRARKPEEPAK